MNPLCKNWASFTSCLVSRPNHSANRSDKITTCIFKTHNNHHCGTNNPLCPRACFGKVLTMCTSLSMLFLSSPLLFFLPLYFLFCPFILSSCPLSLTSGEPTAGTGAQRGERVTLPISVVRPNISHNIFTI